MIIFFFLAVSGNLLAQVLLLEKPQAGDLWPGYSIQRIKWTSSNIDNIKIESSLDSGRTWNMVISSYPASAQYYDWEVPNKISDSCYIRITDITNSATSSSNFKNNPFRIPPAAIALDSLAAVQIMHTAIPVTWTSGGVRRVTLFISYDNQVSFQKIADSIPANRFYYNWTIPAVTQNKVYLKLQDAENPSLFSTSPAPFSIQSNLTANPMKYKGGRFDGHTVANNLLPRLVFTRPTVSDSAFGSDVYIISWAHNNVDRINLQYSIDNGLNWNTIVSALSASAGRYEWIVPNTPTTQCRLRIVNNTDSSLQETTSFPFIIRKKILQLTSPLAEQPLFRGTVIPISWNSGGISQLKIKYLSNNKAILIRDSVPVRNETFNWIIPDSIVGTCKIVIQDKADSTASDTSATLTIASIAVPAVAKFRGGGFDGHSSVSNVRSKLQLLSPNEADKIAVSMNTSITWNATNIERVNLYFSPDNGSTWTRIFANIAASAGKQNWRTPNSLAAKCLLRIEDANDSTVFDISKTSFELLPKQINNNTDSLNWIKKTAKAIEWTTLGVDAIRIYYKLNEKGGWLLLKDSVPATYETFNWILPANLKDTLWVRLQDQSDSTVMVDKKYTPILNLSETFSASKYHGGSFDGHSQRSNITKIIVQRPIENEVLTTGTIYTIKWTTVNMEDSILLQYSIDSGATWTTIARTIASLGQYEWKIPAVLSSFNPPQFMSIKTQSAGSNGGYEYKNNGGSGVANKCLIRALDPASGNTLVGISSKPFTIAAKDISLKADINFPMPAEREYKAGLQIFLTASSVTGNPVTYFIVKGDATLSKDTLFISKAGPLTVGVFAPAKNGYLNSDTIYRSFCVNPSRPIVMVNGDTTACSRDTLTLIASSVSGNQWYRNGQPIDGTNEVILRIQTSGTYTDSLNESGCKSGSRAVTIDFRLRPEIPIITANKTSICSGDKVTLKSSNKTGNRWLLNGNLVAGNGDSILLASQAGKYRVLTSMNGCDSDTSSSFELVVNPTPASPQVSPLKVCQGNPVYLSAVKIRGTELLWYTDSIGGSPLPGTPIPAADKPGQIAYYVSQRYPETGCESRRSELRVSIGSLPAQPVITRTGDRLISTPANQYKWYLNNQLLSTTDSNQLKIPASGSYWVAVSNDSTCWLQSANYLVQEDPIFPTQDSLQALAYPNPTLGQFFVQLQAKNPINGFVNLQVFDIKGVLITSIQRFVFNERRVRIPVYTYLNKSFYTIRITVNGYLTKNIQLIGL